VLKREDASLSEALIPGRAESRSAIPPVDRPG
jgi:hypothetical protein